MKNIISLLSLAGFLFSNQTMSQQTAGLSECKAHLSVIKEKISEYKEFCGNLKTVSLQEIRSNSTSYAEDLDKLNPVLTARNFSDFSVRYKEGTEISSSAKVKTISEVYFTINKLIAIIRNKVVLLNEVSSVEELTKNLASIQQYEQKLIDYLNLNIENIE